MGVAVVLRRDVGRGHAQRLGDWGLQGKTETASDWRAVCCKPRRAVLILTMELLVQTPGLNDPLHCNRMSTTVARWHTAVAKPRQERTSRYELKFAEPMCIRVKRRPFNGSLRAWWSSARGTSLQWHVVAHPIAPKCSLSCKPALGLEVWSAL